MISKWAIYFFQLYLPRVVQFKICIWGTNLSLDIPGLWPGQRWDDSSQPGATKERRRGGEAERRRGGEVICWKLQAWSLCEMTWADTLTGDTDREIWRLRTRRGGADWQLEWPGTDPHSVIRPVTRHQAETYWRIKCLEMETDFDMLLLQLLTFHAIVLYIVCT